MLLYASGQTKNHFKIMLKLLFSARKLCHVADYFSTTEKYPHKFNPFIVTSTGEYL